VGRSLWREDGSAVCQTQSAVISLLSVCTICILQVIKYMYIQHIQGLSQFRLSTIDHALLLVAPATTAQLGCQSQSQSHIATDGQSVCLSWCRAPSGAHDQILLTVWQLLSCPWEGTLSDERTGLSFVSQSAVLGPLSVCTIFTFYMCHMLLNTYTIYTRSTSVRAIN
jgi:hypothetical protein